MQQKPISPELLAQILSPEVQKRFWSKVAIKGPNECWPWMASRLPKGYGAFGIWRHDKTIPTRAHKMAWISHNKTDVPDGLHVLHSCIGNPGCCNPAHLRPGTQKENTADMFNQGRQNRTKLLGERVWNSILNAQIVHEFRQLRSFGYTCSQIGVAYGIKTSTVYAAVSGATWKHI